MSIEAYLKALLPEDEPLKEISFDGVMVNTQEAILATHSAESILSALDIDQEEMPAEISLVVTLRPKKLMDVKGDYTFAFSSGDIDFSPITLGQLTGGLVHECCAAVEVIWQGEGSQKSSLYGLIEPLCEDLLNFEKGVFYTKNFTLPPGNSFFSKEIYTKEGACLYECSFWENARLEEHPIVPLGGFFHNGLDLEMVMPMYGLLGIDSHKTAVIIKGQSYWQRAGLYPERRGKIADRYYSLVPLPIPFIQTSLAQDVRGGEIRFGPLEASYVSYDYDLIDPDTNTILLHLKQG